MAGSASAREIDWLNDWLDEQTVLKSFKDIDINASTADPVINHLEDFTINRISVNNNRAFQMLTVNPRACSGKTIRTPVREQVMVYSDFPQIIYPGFRVYFRGDDSRFDNIKDGEKTLREIFALANDIRAGVTDGRSYGEHYDAVFSAPDLADQVWRRSGRDSAIGLIEMMLNSRIDIVIEHPVTVQNYLRQRGGEANLNSVKPSDANTYVLGYFACARSDFGIAAMQEINARHRQVSRQRSYLDAQLHWIEPSARREFIRTYNKIFSTKFRLSE